MDATRGQRWSLKSDVIDVVFNLDIADGVPVATAIVCLGANGKALGPPLPLGESSGDDAVTAVPNRADAARVHLGKLPAELDRLVFVIALMEREPAARGTLRAVRGGQVILHDGEELHHLRVDGSEFATSTSASFVEIYRKGGWRAWFAADGWTTGDEGALGRYGIPSRDWPPPPPRPSSGGFGRGGPIAPIPPVGSGPSVGPQRAARLPRVASPSLERPTPATMTPAVSMVLVSTPSGPANGTAFFVTPGGLAVTCAHVVHDATEILLLAEGEKDPRRARVRAIDMGADLALIAPEDHDGVLHWLDVAPPSVPRGLGIEVGLFGYPLGSKLGLSLTYSQGVVNSTREHNDVKVLQIDAGAAPGSSGGPVFQRSDGRVIAVLTSGLINGPAGMLVNFALDLSHAWKAGWFVD